MSKENSSATKQPDFQASVVRESVMKDGNTETRKEKWHDFGAAYNRKNGYIAIDSPLGTIMLTPKEELDRMRAEKQNQPAQTQSQQQQP